MVTDERGERIKRGCRKFQEMNPFLHLLRREKMLDAIEGFLQYGFVQLEPIWSSQVSGNGLYIQCLGKTGGGKSCFTRQKGLWIIQQRTFTLDHLITTHINDLFVCKIMLCLDI